MEIDSKDLNSYDLKWIIPIGCFSLVISLYDCDISGGRNGETFLYAGITGFDTELGKRNWSDLTDFVKFGFPYTVILAKNESPVGEMRLILGEVGESISGNYAGFLWDDQVDLEPLPF